MDDHVCMHGPWSDDGIRRFKDRKLAARKDGQFSEAAPEELGLQQAGGAAAAVSHQEDESSVVVRMEGRVG